MRIYRAPTWTFRKFSGGIKCFEENGLQYTIHRFFEKLKNKICHWCDADVPRDYQFYSSLPACRYKKELKRWYKKHTGVKLNLNRPKTFGEKIQWAKLYDSTPLKTKLTDKLLVRDWVKERIGAKYLIPLLGVWDSFNEINFDELPDRFVLKCNHGSGMNLIVKDKSKLDYSDAKTKFDKWMATNFAFVNGFELQYKNISPKIIAEKYLGEIDELLIEYHGYCFNGVVEYIEILQGEKHQRKAALVNRDWIRCKNWNPAFDDFVEDLYKPPIADELLQIMEILSHRFPFVRVDLYSDNIEKIYFGEMTFTPRSGLGDFVPNSYNLILGEKIKITY